MVYLYLIFLINLVKEHLKSMMSVLKSLHKLRDDSGLSYEIVDARSKSIRRNEKFFNALTKLKSAYGILLTDSVGIINGLLGLPILSATIVLVMGNISSGYKVFLSTMDDVLIERIAGEHDRSIKQL